LLIFLESIGYGVMEKWSIGVLRKNFNPSSITPTLRIELLLKALKIYCLILS